MPVRRCLVLLILCLLATLSAPGLEQYRTETLCRIPIGRDTAAVSVGYDARSRSWYGPDQIVVADDGTLYLSDAGNHRIKAFDRHGRFLFGTEKLVRGPRSIALDLFDNIYTLDTPRRIVEYSPAGERIYEYHIPHAIPDLQCLYPVFDDAIPARVKPGVLAVFLQQALPGQTREADFQYLLPGDLGSAGRTVAAFRPDGLWKYTLVSSTLGRRAMGEYALTMNDATRRRLVKHRADPSQISWYVDADRYAYLIAPVHDSRPPVARMPHVPSVVAYCVVIFNQQGQQSAFMQLPATPFPMLQPIAVDYDGNLYHLAMQGNAITVIRERLLTLRTTEKNQVTPPAPPPLLLLVAGLILTGLGIVSACSLFWRSKRILSQAEATKEEPPSTC